MIAFLESYGLIVLFALIVFESAGVPLPGETALITAGVLSSRGTFSIAMVIAVAAGAAILGDNLGYAAGRFARRRVLDAWPWLSRRVGRVLPRSERFFERHGSKAVFFARFLPVLRVTGAWTAGMSMMTWWRFLLWNALGGITWAALFGISTYVAGEAAGRAMARYGFIGAGAAAIVLAGGGLALHVLRRRSAATRAQHSTSRATELGVALPVLARLREDA